MNPSFLLLTLSSLLSLLLPIPPLIKLYKTSDNCLLGNGYIFFNAMNNVSWIIYGFMSGNMLFQNFLFLPFSLMLLTIFLIIKREYANIVYNNVIIINYSWWIRQQDAETVFNWSCFIMVLFLLVPTLMNIWKLKKEKEEKFSDKRLIGGHFIITLLYIILFFREKK